MPSEERSITFDFGEVFTALEVFSAQINEKYLPSGKITSIRAKESEKGILVLQVLGRTSRNTEEVELSEGFVAASLLMHCIGSGIPLPKAAKKSIEVGENLVILRLN